MIPVKCIVVLGVVKVWSLSLVDKTLYLIVVFSALSASFVIDGPR